MAVDKAAIDGMSPDEKRKLARQILAKQKQKQSAESGPGAAPGDSAPARRPQTEALPEEFHRFDLFPEYVAIKQQTEAGQQMGMKYNPFLQPHSDVSTDTITVDGTEYISFSGYNYLGLSGDPRINTAVTEAVEQFGTSPSASRLVGGEITIHRDLERGIAEFIGVEDSVVMVSGWGTNVATIGHLFRPGDLILHDSLMHNSLLMGVQLSGARRLPFPHNDWEAADRLLTEHRRNYERVLIVIEGAYSMDGDYPDLPDFVTVAKRHKAFLMVDEAHSAGTMGATGRGIAEHFGIDPNDVDIWMGTLSKTYASCGGYIAGSSALVEQLKYLCSGFVYSVGISPANTAAALAALEILKAEPWRVADVQARSRYFLNSAKDRGLNTGPAMGAPIVPIILGSSIVTLMVAQEMFAAGIDAKPVLYPAVAEGETRLRFFINALHSEAQIDTTIETAARLVAKAEADGLYDLGDLTGAGR
jgi:8-amino-7-oxononanoate synthase